MTHYLYFNNFQTISQARCINKGQEYFFILFIQNFYNVVIQISRLQL